MNDLGLAQKRASDARVLLDNDEFKRALSEYRAGCVEAIRLCRKEDDLGRYRLAVALDVTDAVERHLRAVLSVSQSAIDAARELQERETLLQRVARQF
jgi:hypothetical protein